MLVLRGQAAIPALRTRNTPCIPCYTSRRRLGVATCPRAAASAAEPAPEPEPAQPSTSETTPEVVEGVVLDEAEAQAISRAEALQACGYTELSESQSSAARLLLIGAGSLHCIVAGVVAVAATTAPGLLLPSAAVDGLSSVLLLCLSAFWLRGGSLLFHVAANSDQLIGLRTLRPCLGMVAVSVVTLLSQAFGIASIQLAGLTTLLALVSGAVCTKVAHVALSTSPPVQFAFIPGAPLGQSLTILMRFWQRDLTSLASVVLLLLAGGALAGFGSVLSQPWGPPSGLPPALEVFALQYSGPAAALRRTVGCGLLLLALQAHTLVDPASRARTYGLDDSVQLSLKQLLIMQHHALGSYLVVQPARWVICNLGFVAAAALQAYAVCQAPQLGVNVNWDGALWGPLYATAFGSLVYGLLAAVSFDFRALLASVQAAMLLVVALVASLFERFVFKREWVESPRR